ncbi:MAG: aldehyde dehydrogenase family protein [Kofleriaceae bacterium]
MAYRPRRHHRSREPGDRGHGRAGPRRRHDLEAAFARTRPAAASWPASPSPSAARSWRRWPRPSRRPRRLITLAMGNGGNTRGDAKFDLDGAAATLAHYAELATTLPAGRILPDGEPIQLGRTARMGGQHVYVPCAGVAVHINAFNFPAWGLAEGGVRAARRPAIISKPATATALVAHRLGELFAPLLPTGTFHLLVGPPQALLDHVGPGDVVAFTGGSATSAAPARTHGHRPRGAARGRGRQPQRRDPRPGRRPRGETGALLLADVVRDMTQKVGQKCTATRRVLVPRAQGRGVRRAARAACRRSSSRSAHEGVRMGPLATATQLRGVRAGIERLAAATESVHGGVGDHHRRRRWRQGLLRQAGGARDRRRARLRAAARRRDLRPGGDGRDLRRRSGDRRRVRRPRRGQPGGVDVLRRSATGSRPTRHRRRRLDRSPHLGSAKMAAQSPGPGTLLPHLVHVGCSAPAAARLGGVRGLHHPMQRTALEGDSSLIKALL